jgi:hypothetical protein
MAVSEHAGQARRAGQSAAEHPLTEFERHQARAALGELPGCDPGSGAAVQYQPARQRPGDPLQLVVDGVRIGRPGRVVVICDLVEP